MWPLEVTFQPRSSCCSLRTISTGNLPLEPKVQNQGSLRTHRPSIPCRFMPGMLSLQGTMPAPFWPHLHSSSSQQCQGEGGQPLRGSRL